MPPPAGAEMVERVPPYMHAGPALLVEHVSPGPDRRHRWQVSKPARHLLLPAHWLSVPLKAKADPELAVSCAGSMSVLTW